MYYELMIEFTKKNSSKRQIGPSLSESSMRIYKMVVGKTTIM